MKKQLPLFGLAAFVLGVLPLQAQTPQLTLTVHSSGYNEPVGIFNSGDDQLYVVEQPGRIKRTSNTGSTPTLFLDISARVGSTGNEQGLLGLAFSPNYTSNGHFFVNYTNLQGHTVVSRFSTNPSGGDPNSEQILLTVNQPYSNHNGGNIMFGPDGYLYIGMGDGGSANDPQNNAQNGNSLLGKMLRIDVSSIPYSIPANSPFLINPAVADEIWAIGLRNPWRFSFDRITGDLWIADVGQNVWEEIDFEPANSTGGLNYGWRCYEANAPAVTSGCQPASSYTAPISEYNHNTGCSVTGGFVYRGGKYGRLYGHYLYTDYCDGIMRTISRDANGGFVDNTLATFLPFQYTSFGEDRFGELYVAARGNGNIYRIQESNCQPTAVILGDSLCPILPLTAVFGEGNSYLWHKNGQPIINAYDSVYSPTESGTYHVVVTNNSNCSSISESITLDTANNNFPVITGLQNFYYGWAQPDTLSSNIPGGVFSGPGIVGNVFNPGLISDGYYKITYTITGPCGFSQSAFQIVQVDNMIGLTEVAQLSELQLFPNPTERNFTVSFRTTRNTTTQIEVLNTLGQVILQKSLELNAGNQEIPFFLPDATSGLYLVRLKTGESIQLARLAIE